LVFPYSSAIDTPLPKVDEDKINHIMLDSKADWIPAPKPDPSKNAFTEYPNMSLEDWHKTFNHYIE
jgi:hypothetical protein